MSFLEFIVSLGHLTAISNVQTTINDKTRFGQNVPLQLSMSNIGGVVRDNFHLTGQNSFTHRVASILVLLGRILPEICPEELSLTRNGNKVK